MIRYLFFLSIVFLFATEATAKFRKCLYGGYRFIGNEYSDEYALKQVNNLSSCNDPLLSSKAEGINQDYLSNKEKIKNLATSILNDSKCKDVKEIVKKYMDKSKEIEDKILANNNDRFDTLNFLKQQKDFEIQSHFVYGGLYNAACSNEDHRTFSMFDLESINQMLAQKVDPPPVKVTNSNKNIDDCSNVEAFGTDDLDGFTVSMKKGTQNFLFAFDPFTVPDQVIVKNQNQKILYDSGCKGNTGLGNSPMKLTLDAPQDSKITVQVINNCTNVNEKGQSAWSLMIKCQVNGGNNICKDQLFEFAELLKKEVEIIKKILDHYELERQCFIAYGDKIWENLINFGFIGEDTRPATLGLCSILDLDCEKRIKDQKQFDLENPRKNIQSDTHKEPEKVLECSKKPGENASIFEMISWSYCNVGVKKLGL